MRTALIFALLVASAFSQETITASFVKSAAGGATWSIVASQTCNASSALTCAMPSNPVQHDTVIVMIGSTTVQTAAACQDGAGTPNAYTVATAAGHFGGGPVQGLFEYVAYLMDAPATANKTITCTGFGAGFHDIQVRQFRDSGGTQVLDQTVGAPDSSLSAPAILFPTFTPAVASSLAVCGVLPNNGISAVGGSWTLSANNNSASEYQTSIAASATSANFTDTASSDNYASACIVVKP